MELRQLSYFLSAARHLSFTRAAEECCIVQSAMSQQMRALERELDVKLFERSNHGLVLTPAGDALAREAKKLMEQVETLQTSVRSARDRGAGILRLGCRDGLLPSAIPKALQAYQKAHPDVCVEVSMGEGDALARALGEDRLDCVVALEGENPARDEGMRSQLILREGYCVMLPGEHALSAKSRVSVRDLMGETVFFCRNGLRELLDHALGASGEGAPRLVRVDSRSEAALLVAAGSGVSVGLMGELGSHPMTAVREIADLPAAGVCVFWRGGSPGEAQAEAFKSVLMMTISE